jgi:hypothetical protein
LLGPIPCVVDRLRDLLKMAENGELVGFAIATLHNDGSWATAHSDASEARLLGVVTYLQARLIRRLEAM